MTKAEKRLILYLMNESGTDYCRKCVHMNKRSCCMYVSPIDFSKEKDDEECIKGMLKFFEREK